MSEKQKCGIRYLRNVPLDLRTLDLQVETMFDEALKLFAQKTTNVLDFGCGTRRYFFSIFAVSAYT
ncbi:MAG: hypothetical protein ACLS9K_11315 [Lachnospira eligens]